MKGTGNWPGREGIPGRGHSRCRSEKPDSAMEDRSPTLTEVELGGVGIWFEAKGNSEWVPRGLMDPVRSVGRCQ